MEQERRSSKPDEELHNNDATNELLLDILADELTPSLNEVISALKVALGESGTDPDELKKLWTEYTLLFEEYIDQAENPDLYTKAQIGAILHKAFMFKDAGNELRYLEELNYAEVYLSNSENSVLRTAIGAEIDTKVAGLEPTPERLILQLRGKIESANQLYLWDLWAEERDYEDLINHAYEMLLNEGEDPEAILAELGILEP